MQCFLFGASDFAEVAQGDNRAERVAKEEAAGDGRLRNALIHDGAEGATDDDSGDHYRRDAVVDLGARAVLQRVMLGPVEGQAYQAVGHEGARGESHGKARVKFKKSDLDGNEDAASAEAANVREAVRQDDYEEPT